MKHPLTLTFNMGALTLTISGSMSMDKIWSGYEVKQVILPVKPRPVQTVYFTFVSTQGSHCTYTIDPVPLSG